MISHQSAIMVFCCSALLLTGCKKDAGAQMGALPPIQVVVAEAKRQPVSESLSLVGTVAADEMVEIRSEIDGNVQAINFEEGQQVTNGQLLIQLDESKLAASVAEAEAQYKLSEANFQRSERLLKGNLIAPQEYDQASSIFAVNKASLDRKRREWKDTRIFAPFGGVMGTRAISPGQVISKDTKLTWLVALDPVKVEVNVPERFLGQVNPGQKIAVTVAAYSNESFKGDVFFVAPQVDPATRTALVKARIPNADHRLKPGMFASLDLTLKIKDDAVVIPEAALILNSESISIYVVEIKDGNPTAQIRTVKVGARMAGQVEITEGLKGGEQVIVEGFQKTQPGGAVKVATTAKQ